MPLAAPLILPFAELAGITIAGLGMAAASKKVSDFISDNPEISTQILTTLVPGGVGLNALFKKKAKEDSDDESVEVAPEDKTREERAKEMKKRFKEGKGDKREIGKKGFEEVIKPVKDIEDLLEGEERYDGSLEDAPKPKFDYKKFIRNRNADGGAIGIEVLFEEKKDGGRIGFANGGIENIIGKNLDNVTNVAKGLDKEMLDMTFDDKYYREKIQPAKLGQAPIPGRMEMMLKSKPFTAVGIGMRPGTFGERAQPTKAASQFLNTLGKGAKFVGTKVGPLSFMDIFASTPLGADDEVTDEMRQSIEMSPTSTTGIMVDANDGFRTSPRTNVQGMDLEMDPATYYNSAPNFNADVLREEEDAQYNLPKTNGIINSLLNMKSTVPQMLLSAATKVPGAGLVLGGLSSLSNLIGNSFENRQLTGEGVIVDEFGRSYDADELNAQNALGGYYTDAARSSRRRDSRIQNMLARQAAGKMISQNNLIALQEQAAREQAARETATAALAAQNASTYGTSGATGGYQSSWGGVDSFMSGSGTAADMGSFADGGRIGYVGGGLATTQDFANALKSVSAGTTYQQQIQAKEYARNEASNLLSQAMRSADPNKGPGLQGIYDTFFRTTLSPGIRPKTFTPDSSGRMIMYSARDRDAILDSMANQMLNTTPYAAPKPRPKTYRTVSPEAQALNMSQSTYEDIIRSGADPKQYYIDYQNRMMTEGGNYGTPGTSSYTGPQLLKYGQVIGGPGMVIAGPGTAPGATPPTQAQMNQMMQNNPAGYMDFADLVKTYSADPYKGLQEEIKDMVGGRDTGYMGGQDYYDINVLGLDGRGIAEKYGLQYADGGLATLFSMKR
jgi:hypothetical protein